jgi:opacity protein-like surface antigen
MRRILAITFVVLIASAVLGAQQTNVAGPAPESEKKRDSYTMVLARFGYFLASDSAFTDIYGNSAVFGGEFRLGGNKIAGWLEANYRSRTGKSSYTQEETKAKVTAIEAGALYRIIPGTILPYLEAGLGFYMFDEKNAFIGEAKQSKIGFCGAVGASMALAKSLVVDARLKYSTCSMKPADYSINIGGLTLGIGIGIRL